MKLHAIGFALALGLVPAPVRAQSSFGKVSNLQIPEDLSLRECFGGDLDGDGKVDLLLSVCDSDQERRSRRFLRIHLRRDREPPFQMQPDRILEIKSDVVALAVGDYRKEPGEEVLLITARAAYAWSMAASEKEAYSRIGECEFLWQLPRERRLLDWRQGRVDLDRDGLDDLYLPEPGGYRLLLQRRGADGAEAPALSAFLELPEEVFSSEATQAVFLGGSRGKEMRARLALNFSDGAGGPLLEVRDVVPAPCFADWEGDGDLDVLVQSEKHLHVWLQGQGGAFSRQPDLALRLPVWADRERRLDLSYNAQVADLNGDRKSDAVIFVGDKRSEELRNQIMIYIHGYGRGAATKTEEAPLFGPRRAAQQLLVVLGFLTQPRIEDLNGDGLPDLSLISLRLDLVEAMRSSKSVDAELYLFLNRGGRFESEPDLVHRVTLRSDELGGGGRLSAQFIGDLGASPFHELLVRSKPDLLRILAVSDRGGLSVRERPVWELPIDRSADVEVLEIPGGATELLIRERKQLLHVRFR